MLQWYFCVFAEFLFSQLTLKIPTKCSEDGDQTTNGDNTLKQTYRNDTILTPSGQGKTPRSHESKPTRAMMVESRDGVSLPHPP